LVKEGFSKKIYSDPRTTEILKFLSGYKKEPKFVCFDDLPLDKVRDGFIVINNYWLRKLSAWYGYTPPHQIQEPPSSWEEVYHFIPPKVKSLRSYLLDLPAFFREELDYSNDLKIYRVR
jgi:hypothetical protein